MEDTETKKFYEMIEQTKPSLSIASELAEKKALKMTAKPDIINIVDENAREQFIKFLEENNWEYQKEKIIYNKSKHGGSCVFLTKIGDDWKLSQTTNIVRIIKDITGKELGIVIYASLWKGNSGKIYYLYETHNSKEIVRSVHVGTDESGARISPNKAYDYNSTPWDSFLIDTKITLEQRIQTDTPTAFMLNNKMLDNENGILGVPDIVLAAREINTLDLAYESMMFTLRFNRSRIILNRQEGSEIDAESEGDRMLNRGVIEIKKEIGFDDKTPPAAILDPNPETIRTTWWAFEKAFEKVLTRVGLANPDDTDSAQKTKIEVSQIRDAEHSELERQIITFQSLLLKLMESIAKILNINIGEEYGWDIQRLDVRQETEILNNLKEMHALGWITLDKAVALVNNVSITEAKAIIEQVKKEKEENKELAIDNSTDEEVDKKVDKKVDNGLTNDGGLDD